MKLYFSFEILRSYLQTYMGPPESRYVEIAEVSAQKINANTLKMHQNRDSHSGTSDPNPRFFDGSFNTRHTAHVLAAY